MPRRVKPKAQRRDWRWYASLALNGAVALSMVLGTVFLFGGAPTPRAESPIEEPTLAPTVTPSPAVTPVPPLTPTPKASAEIVRSPSRDIPGTAMLSMPSRFNAWQAMAARF